MSQSRKRLEHAAAHASHTRDATCSTARALLFGSVNNAAFAGGEERSDTRSILESGADDLERVKDAGSDHVFVFANRGVVTKGEFARVFEQAANYNAAFLTGVLDNGSGRAAQSSTDNADTELLVEVGSLDSVESLGGLQESCATTWNDTLLDGSASRVERVVVAVLLLADLDLGSATDLDDSDTTAQLGKTLLQLGAVVVRGSGVVDSTADLLAASSKRVLVTFPVEEDGVLLGDSNTAAGTKKVGGCAVKLDLKLVGEDGTTGKDGKVTEDRLAVVTEARCLDGAHLKLAAEFVQDAGSEGLTVNVLSNDEEGATGLGSSLERRQNVLEQRDLLLRKQDQGLLEFGLLGLDVGDEVRGDVTTVEAHALSDLDLVFKGAAFLDGDDALLANLLHSSSDQVADVLVAVGRDSGDLKYEHYAGAILISMEKWKARIFERPATIFMSGLHSNNVWPSVTVIRCNVQLT